MVMPTSSYLNMTLAINPGDVQNDQEGIETFQTLGKNMAVLLQQLKNRGKCDDYDKSKGKRDVDKHYEGDSAA
jgi:hypothetical protein